MTRREVVSKQAQPISIPLTSGHTTLTFSGPSKPIREETYVNKVFQQNDPVPQKKVISANQSCVLMCLSLTVIVSDWMSS